MCEHILKGCHHLECYQDRMTGDYRVNAWIGWKWISRPKDWAWIGWKWVSELVSERICCHVGLLKSNFPSEKKNTGSKEREGNSAEMTWKRERDTHTDSGTERHVPTGSFKLKNSHTSRFWWLSALWQTESQPSQALFKKSEDLTVCRFNSQNSNFWKLEALEFRQR